MSKINTEEAKAISILLVVVFLIILGVVFANKILEFLGLKEDKEDKKLNAAAATAENAGFLSSRFLNTAPKGAKLFTVKDGDTLAKRIYDAIGIFYDDEDEIKAVFNKCKTQSQAAWIARSFENRYKKDLNTFLTEKLDTEKQKAVYVSIVNQIKALPKY